MKNLLFALLISFALFGCKKAETVQPDTLKTTTWISGKWKRTVLYVTVQSGTGVNIPNDYTANELNFIDDTYVTSTEYNNASLKFVYTIDGSNPNINFNGGIWSINKTSATTLTLKMQGTVGTAIIWYNADYVKL